MYALIKENIKENVQRNFCLQLIPRHNFPFCRLIKYFNHSSRGRIPLSLLSLSLNYYFFSKSHSLNIYRAEMERPTVQFTAASSVPKCPTDNQQHRNDI